MSVVTRLCTWLWLGDVRQGPAHPLPRGLAKGENLGHRGKAVRGGGGKSTGY